jgi:hypothetical protein
MVFSYSVLSTYGSGHNQTTVTTAVEEVSIVSVNLSASLGEFGYTFTMLNINGTNQTASAGPAAVNFTTIFDPYNNLTYTGSIGFWPVIYTDVRAGSVKDVELNQTYTAPNPSGSGTMTYNAVQYFNATVTRANGIIDVNMHILPLLESNQTGSGLMMNFSATTGVLERMVDKVNVLSPIEEILTYNLVSFTQPASLNLSFVPYVLVAAVVAVVAFELARRKPKAERKKAKLREKFAKAR